MSLSKKYVYVHSCSETLTADNFRNALGRAWVESVHSGLQYGYEVNPRPFKMTFGPIMEWAQDYFYATEMPAKTQVVSISANPSVFPYTEESTDSDPDCCGWEEYIKNNFYDHFSVGDPIQILKYILARRARNYEDHILKGEIQSLVDPFLPGNTCAGSYRIGDAQAGRLFRDLWFQVMTPFSEVEDRYIEGKEKALTSDVTFNYNFYLEEYERLLAMVMPEIEIPNLYLTIGQDGSVPYVIYLQNNVGCRFQEFSKLFLQKGYRELLIPVKQLPFLQDNNIYSSSFPMDAKISFGTDRSTFTADALEDSKMESVMLRRLSEGEILLDRTDPLSPPVPYTDSTLKNITPPREFDHEPLSFKFAKRYYSTLNVSRSRSSGPYARDLKTFDIYQWLMSLPDLPPSAVPLPGDHIFLGNENDSTDMALRSNLYQPQMSFLANYFILSGKINNIAKTNLRSYQQMMRGDTPHSEAIAYRISKYSTAALEAAQGTSGTGEGISTFRIPSATSSTLNLSGTSLGYDLPSSATATGVQTIDSVLQELEETFDFISQSGVQPIQNVWIPNSNTVDVIEYVDTQIKYNKGYTYVVTAYELSTGTEYFYSQYRKTPAPEPCDDLDLGMIDVTGQYTSSQMQPIANILQNSSLSEGDKYQAIVAYIKNSLDPSFNANGTHIGIYAKRKIVGAPDLSGVDPDLIPGLANTGMLAPNTEYTYIIISYCYDHSGVKGWHRLANIANLPSTTAGNTQNKDGACEVFVRLEKILKTKISASDASPKLAARFKKAGLTLPSTNSLTVRENRFQIKRCPDHWVEGKKYSKTRETSASVPISDKSNLEMVYLGKESLEVTCECPPPEPCKETFLVTTIPTLKVHEVPYFMWTGKAVDSYPVGPDVEVAPYRAVNKELLFLVGAGLGDYYGRPIPILPSDVNNFLELQQAQNSKDGIVKFSSDDPVQAFQVFMLTSKPKRYTDFANGAVRNIAARVPDRPGQKTDAISFIDPVTPNQKYYYIFRSVDVHGHVSNPTPIYEVELVDSDGAIYPLVNVYEPDIELPIDLSKQAQRLIQVRPEYLQSVIDIEGSGLSSATSAYETVGDIKLGAREHKLWGKKFKFRLTSCESRRKLDINLNFKTKYLEDPDKPCQPENVLSQAPEENKGLLVPDYPLPGTPEYEERAAAIEAALPDALEGLAESQSENYEETSTSLNYMIE